MKTVHSYIRFSSKPQEWGDSERRQDKAAQDYCDRNGLTLSKMSYADRGVSAKAGKNRADGSAFAELLTMVKPHDIILIEDNDRFSREDPITALADLKRILSQKEISVVFLSTGVEVTKKNFNEPSVLFPNFFKGYLGYSENQKKGERILAAWSERQKDINEGKDRFGKLPFWLIRDKNTKELHVNKEAANVVKLIYKLSREGKGVRAITDYLNEHKTPLFRSNSKRNMWVTSTVQFVLKTPTVYGAYQNKRLDNGKRIAIGPIVENVLPVIVKKDEALLVMDRAASRHSIFKGRFDPNKISNLFTGIAKCAHCEDNMIYSKKGKHGYLVCGNHHFNKGCQTGYVMYHVLERTFFKFLRYADTERKFFTSNGDEGDTVTTLQTELESVRGKIKRTMRIFIELGDERAMDEIKRLKSDETKLLNELANKQVNQRTFDNFPKAFKELVMFFLGGDTDRVGLREKVRSVLKVMRIDAKSNSFSLTWHTGRHSDIIELKQVFNGPRPATWYYRFKEGIKGATFSDWITDSVSTVTTYNESGIEEIEEIGISEVTLK